MAVWMSVSVPVRIIAPGRRRLAFPLYETQQVRLSAQKVRMFKVPKFVFRVGTEDALLEVGDLVEAVHVELADE